jgi:hypothetical protein
MTAGNKRGPPVAAYPIFRRFDQAARKFPRPNLIDTFALPTTTVSLPTSATSA